MNKSNNENYNILEKTLEKYGKTMKDLYDNNVVSRQLISEFKSGRTQTLSQAKAAQIAEFVGCTISEIYGERSPIIFRSAKHLTDVHEIIKIPADEFSEVDQELYDILDEMKDRPDLRVLFHNAKDASPEQIRSVADMLAKFKQG